MINSDSTLEAFTHCSTEYQIRDFLKNLTERGRGRLSTHGHIALQRAIESNNPGVVRALLEQPEIQVNLPLEGQDGNTAPHIAVLLQAKDILQMLLDRRDLDPNVGNGRGETPLHLASNCLHILELLVSDPRVNVAAVTRDKQSALHIACNLDIANLGYNSTSKAQVLEVVRKLISLAASNARISFSQFLGQQDVFGRTALHYAAGSGLEDTISEIVNNLEPGSSDGRLALVQDNGNCIALHLAAEKGHLRAVQRLLPFGECKDHSDGATALHYAVRSGRQDILQACLAEKCFLSEYTILEDAVHLYVELLAIATNYKVAIYLLASLYDYHIVAKREFPSLLHWVVKVGDNDGHGAPLVGHILKWQPERANAPLDEDTERTPLHVATMLGNQSVVLALCRESGSWYLNGNERDLHNNTALDYAFESGNEPIQRILMDRKDVQRHLRRLHKNRNTYVMASNSILVVSVLIATLTYAKCLTRDEAAEQRITTSGENLELRIVNTVVSTRIAFLLSMTSTILAAFSALPFSFGLFFVQTVDDNLVRRSMFRTRVLVVLASYFLVWSLCTVTFAFLCSQAVAPYIDYKCELVCEVVVGLFIVLSVVFMVANCVKFRSKLRKAKSPRSCRVQAGAGLPL